MLEPHKPIVMGGKTKKALNARAVPDDVCPMRLTPCYHLFESKSEET